MTTRQESVTPATPPPLLRLEGVTKKYPVRGGVLTAVDRVSIDIAPGKVLGVVGESGCGKTTLSRMMLRMTEPTSGAVQFKGDDIWALDGGKQKLFRKSVSAVFQDPYSSLNPRHRIDKAIMEPVLVNAGKGSVTGGLLEHLLTTVGLPITAAKLYPHEFSGGQRQRIAIARAISTQPELVLLDEPVSALDVSIRAQVLNLLKDLQHDTGVSYVFIAHDLSAVRYMSDEIIVVYLGAIVERASANKLYQTPRHPYTKALLEASLPPDPRNPSLTTQLRGDLPNPINAPSGCRFRTRCPIAAKICADSEPEFREVGSGHRAACHFA